MTRSQRLILILVLGALTAVGPFSIDMYLPGFPAIARDLRTDIAHVALSLTSYFIGISVGQLGAGPLLDRFGRRKPLIIGLLLYIVAAIGCGLSPDIHWLVAQRFLLALGGCVGIVGARAIVRDLFPVNEIARVFSTLMLVLGVSPILAPSVGAYVAEAYSWRLIFAVLAAIAAIVLLAVVRLLPESRAADRSVSLHPFSMTRNYFGVLRHPMFLAYGIASASASAGLFAYISDSPFVFMQLFGMTEQEFGLAFSLSAVGVIGASQVNRAVLRRWSSARIAMVSASVQCVAGLVMVVSVLTGLHPAGFFGAMFCYLICVGFLSPNATALAMEPFTSFAGTASALMGSMQMIAGAVGSSLTSWFHDGTALPMTILLMVSPVVSFAVQVMYRSWSTPGSLGQRRQDAKEG